MVNLPIIFTLQSGPSAQAHLDRLLMKRALFQEVACSWGLPCQEPNTHAGAHVNDPISQETRDTWLNALTPFIDLEVADVWGGHRMAKEDTGGASWLLVYRAGELHPQPR